MRDDRYDDKHRTAHAYASMVCHALSASLLMLGYRMTLPLWSGKRAGGAKIVARRSGLS